MENTNKSSGFNSMAGDSIQDEDQSARMEMINKLDSLLEKYQNYNFNDEIVLVMKQLKRKRKEFDATRFFVLVVGPVKSGKSTLVNIFARKYVSPTAYKECTALPTIIGKSDKEHLNKIIQYFPTDKYSSENEQKETFDYIVDVIREVENSDVLNGRVKKIVSELTKEKVKEIVTLYHDEEIDKNELIVSIGIEGDGFIDDEIMLIDMPGLDGSKRHKDNTITYSNMAERADVVFFVQSTSSAINKASIEFLNQLFDKKEGKVPVWLIHNIHDSQYFLAEDSKKEDDIKEQIAIGKKRIKEGFKIDKFEDISLNLGKIYAAIDELDRVKPDKKDEIIETFEQYKRIEAELISTLKKERQIIKDTISIGKAKDVINKSISIVENLVNENTSRIKELNDKIRSMDSLSNKFDKVQIFDSPFLAEYDSLLVRESIKNSWETKIIQIIESYKSNGGDEISGKDLKAKIDQITQDCSNTIPVGVGSQFRTCLSSSLKSTILSSTEQTIKDIEHEIKMISPNLEIDLIQKIEDKYLNCKSTEFVAFYSNIQEKERKLYLLGAKGSKNYKHSVQNEYLQIISNYLIESIPSKLLDYRDILKTDFITIRDKFIESLKEQINEFAKLYSKEQNELVNKLKQEVTVMNEMLIDLKS